MTELNHPPITIKCADEPSAFILGYLIKMVDDGIIRADGFKSWTPDGNNLTIIIRKSPELLELEAERVREREEREATAIRRNIDAMPWASPKNFRAWQSETFGEPDEMPEEARQAEYDHEAEMERESENAMIRRKYGVESA